MPSKSKTLGRIIQGLRGLEKVTIFPLSHSSLAFPWFAQLPHGQVMPVASLVPVPQVLGGSHYSSLLLSDLSESIHQSIVEGIRSLHPALCHTPPRTTYRPDKPL